MGTYENTAGLSYPLTSMNFLVTVNNKNGLAAFTEVSGIDATVDVREFRQGNSHSLSKVKIPGLVSHSEITLKFGYTLNNAFKTWIQECVSETRREIPRSAVQIELIDINGGAPDKKVEATQGGRIWQLSEAFVKNYRAPTLNSMDTAIAMESVTLVYEELVIPN